MALQDSDGGRSGGATVQIDRLLDTVVRTGASDLHLTVGRVTSKKST